MSSGTCQVWFTLGDKGLQGQFRDVQNIETLYEKLGNVDLLE